MTSTMTILSTPMTLNILCFSRPRVNRIKEMMPASRAFVEFMIQNAPPIIRINTMIPACPHKTLEYRPEHLPCLWLAVQGLDMRVLSLLFPSIVSDLFDIIAAWQKPGQDSREDDQKKR